MIASIAQDPRASGSGRAARDRKYAQSEQGRSTRRVARIKYEATQIGWARKALRRIRYRCENPNEKTWLRYGGRGILVLLTAEEIVTLIGGDYIGRHVHRINNDGHYEFGNVVLLTGEQHRAVHNDGVPI